MPHEPIQFGPRRGEPNEAELPVDADRTPPAKIDVDRERAVTLTWLDGTTSVLPVPLLRRMSPSAEAKAWREEQANNPLAVMTAQAAATMSGGASLRIENAELVGKYAIRLVFSDRHSSGLYTWDYLRTLASREATT
ncbi:MAG: DUF971 domain-containing protein [Planctomycetota bacterium]